MSNNENTDFKADLKADVKDSSNSTTTGSSASGAEIKQRLVDVASKLFAEKNFEGVSVREIASLGQVNVAMISYYFGGKEGLYLECIAQFAQGHNEVLQRILTPVKTQEEFKVRLQLFFETMLALFASDKHLARIVIREAQIDRGEEFRKKVMVHMHPFFLKVQTYYEEAIAAGVLKPETNAQVLASMTMAVISHPCIMEKAIEAACGFSINTADFQKQYIKQICDTFFFGVLA